MATTPPIQIGSLTDVPAPGSQLAAQFHQEVANRVAQRFPNRAALDAWNAEAGSIGVTLDDGAVFRRKGAVWSRITPYTASALMTAVVNIPVATWTTIISLTIPADPAPRLLNAMWHGRGLYWEPYENHVALLVDGVNVAQMSVPILPGDPLGNFHYWTLQPSVMGLPIAANKPITVIGQAYHATGGTQISYNDLNNPALNKLSVYVVGA